MSRPMASMARVALVLMLGFTPGMAGAQTPESSPPDQEERSSGAGRASSTAKFLAGGLAGLAAHESGHLLFDVVFDADPQLKRVDFHGIPFFAITHPPDLPSRQELIISSAGFWVQHAGSEWILTSRPNLRSERAPFLKGVLTFNVLTSVAYAGAAFARTGPYERDTRGMAEAARVDERWIGALVLAPAVLDGWRYFDPDSKWAPWMSRAAKVGMVLLLVR